MVDDEDLLLSSYIKNISKCLHIEKEKKYYYDDLKNNGLDIFKFKISDKSSKTSYHIFNNIAKTARKNKML